MNQQRREKLGKDEGQSRSDMRRSLRAIDKNDRLFAPAKVSKMIASRVMQCSTMGEDDMLSAMNKSFRRSNTKENDSKLIYNESTGSVLRDSSRIDASGTPGRRNRRR
jgi:hypothetical protein